MPILLQAEARSMRQDLSEVRRRAWETRRQIYGPKGHGAAYRQAGRCARCRQLLGEIEQLRARLKDQGLAENVKCETSEAVTS